MFLERPNVFRGIDSQRNHDSAPYQASLLVSKRLSGLPLRRAPVTLRGMTLGIAVLFLIIGVTFVVFATEWLRTDVLALSVLCVLGLLGHFWPNEFLTSEEVFGCFSNPAPITVAAMFILGAGLTRTDSLSGLTTLFTRLADQGELAVLAVMMAVFIAVSAFINNTAVVAFFLPVVFQVCASKQFPPSRFLIPLSYSAMFGGTCVLIGTSTNIVINNVVARHGLPEIEMFEPTRMGLVYAAVGSLYILFIGRHLLPSRETLTSLLLGSRSKEYRTDLVILRNSPLIGQRLGDIRAKKLRAGTVLGVTRDNVPLDPPFDHVVLQDGDRILVNLALSGVREVQATAGIALLPEAELGIEQLSAAETTFVEAIIPMNSALQGKTLRELNFAHRHGVRIIAMHRHGLSVREKFEEQPLHFGDTLLLQGTEEAITSVRDDRAVMLLSPVKVPASRQHKGWLAIGIIGAVIAADAFNILPISHAALMGALALVLTGCLDMNEAYEAINWNIIMLIIGSLGLGLAMEKSGGAEFLTAQIHHWFGAYGPRVAVSGIYLFSMILTELIANNAVAALMTPIAINTCYALGLQDPRPFIFAVMFAASAAFATPIGYQTNTMIFGAGGYKFTDFFKIGLPLNVLLWVVASIFIPIFWPLR